MKNMKRKPDNLITLAEFRQLFGVPASTLRYWTATGRIHVVKIPNGRGGFSRRIKRLKTLADLITLERSFAMRPARGPCPRLPLPVPFREAVCKLTQTMQKKGENYQKKGKPFVASWRSILKSYKWTNETEIERAIIAKAKTIRL